MIGIDGIVIALGVVAAAVIVAGIVWTVLQVWRAPGLSDLARAVWIVAIIAGPILGLVAWFLFDSARAKSAGLSAPPVPRSR